MEVSMNQIEISKELVQFIQDSPSMFHSVHTAAKYLEDAGFTYLKEGEAWKLNQGGKYFTTRNGSSLIGFTIGKELDDYHFQMSAAHSDSPTYKIKSAAELPGVNEYLRLDVEAYGGMIDSTWFDRPLSVAGRVLVKDGTQIKNELVYIDKDILLIPNVAIHFNRQVNDGYKYNRQVDLLPLFSSGEMKKGSFDQMVADWMKVDVKDILGKDLFLVNRQQPVIWGWKDEFVSSPKLDDLQCAFVSLKAFLNSMNDHAINVYCLFDNEEVGSNTKQGAMSTLLKDTLRRINAALGKNEEDYYRAVAKSFLVSCDNAHAVHPNHPEKTDDENCTYLNQGIVIKESANQKYTTDAFSRSLFTYVCQLANVPVQNFANRSDVLGGSTLGNLSNTQVSVNAVDIGLPQLAMHSSYETAGIKDSAYAIAALEKYFNTNIQIDESMKVTFEE